MFSDILQKSEYLLINENVLVEQTYRQGFSLSRIFFLKITVNSILYILFHFKFFATIMILKSNPQYQKFGYVICPLLIFCVLSFTYLFKRQFCWVLFLFINSFLFFFILKVSEYLQRNQLKQRQPPWKIWLLMRRQGIDDTKKDNQRKGFTTSGIVPFIKKKHASWIRSA